VQFLSWKLLFGEAEVSILPGFLLSTFRLPQNHRKALPFGTVIRRANWFRACKENARARRAAERTRELVRTRWCPLWFCGSILPALLAASHLLGSIHSAAFLIQLIRALAGFFLMSASGRFGLSEVRGLELMGE
jgi:hypothetical protein